MKPSELAAQVAARKAATLSKLQPVKIAARAAVEQNWKKSRELKEAINSNKKRSD